MAVTYRSTVCQLMKHLFYSQNPSAQVGKLGPGYFEPFLRGALAAILVSKFWTIIQPKQQA
jgi:hypothetical protein